MILIAGFMHCSTLKVILEIIKNNTYVWAFYFLFLYKTTSFSYFFLIKKTTVENNEYLMFNDDEDVRLQTDNYKKYFTK